jgi:hypothetical protein
MKYIPHPDIIPFEYDKINSYIYLGSNACCELHLKKNF